MLRQMIVGQVGEDANVEAPQLGISATQGLTRRLDSRVTCTQTGRSRQRTVKTLQRARDIDWLPAKLVADGCLTEHGTLGTFQCRCDQASSRSFAVRTRDADGR